MLKLATVLVTLSTILTPTIQSAPDWQRGTPPLSTPWTDDVSPTNALPEYPRPQLTRPEWRNLNGLWEFAAAAPGEQPPIGRALSLYEEDFLEGLSLQAGVALENARYHERNLEWTRVQRDLEAARQLLFEDALWMEAERDPGA